MEVVKPQDWTTLILDQNYLALDVITAKATFYHLLKGHGFGLDANGMQYDFDQMQSKNLALRPNQPVMRSAPNVVTGEETVWPIPTIFVCNWRFFFKGKKKWGDDNLPPLKEVFDFYGGICQRCLRKVKFADASRDHWNPRHLGCGGGFKNITLMHKDCNSFLGHSFPKFNVKGEEIVPRMKVNAAHFILPEYVNMRPEWRQLLFLD